MPRQSKDTQSKIVTAEVAVPVAAEAVKPSADVSVKKPRAPRKKVVEEVVPVKEEVIEEEVQETVTNPPQEVDASSEPAVVEDGAKTRSAVTRESVMTDFSELVSLIDEHVLKLRDTTDKSNGVKFLRSVNKRLKSLQTNTARVLKQKQPSSRKNNNAGFLKPVKISGDMSKFTGLDPNGLHSRVDVTKFLCGYVKDHNLQNPADKRQINADPALMKLLNYDPKKADKPLTYYHLQFLLKNHFTKSV